MKSLPILIIAVLLLTIGTVIVSAQETGTDQLSDPGILPDSPIYGIKKLFERIGTTLTFGDEAKMQRNIDLAETRLAEAIIMSEKGKTVNGLITEYNNRIAEANKLGNMTYGEKRERMLEQMANATNRHLAIMERVRQHVPEQARHGIDKAIEKTTIRNQQILENLEEVVPGQSSNLILNLIEEKTNRLVAEIQYESPKNWSDMRDRVVADIDRQIVILEKLKEKVKIEESKEGIQQAIDRLKEWKEKLLDMEIQKLDIPRPRLVPTFTVPPRPTPHLFEAGNVLTIGVVWNAETPMTVKIKVTAVGIPVDGVNVKINGVDSGVTDSKGELIHTFQNLGSHKVHVSKSGYKDSDITLTLMREGISILTGSVK